MTSPGGVFGASRSPLRVGLLLGCLCSLSCSGKPEGATVIPPSILPPEAHLYFGWSDLPYYWGMDSSEWMMGLGQVEGPWYYVEKGARGESISLPVIVFTKDPDWKQWANRKALRVTLTVASSNLPDFRITRTIETLGFQGNSFGSAWNLNAPLSLYSLDRHWGHLPRRITLSAALEEEGSPRVTTSKQDINLVATMAEDASWTDRVEALRIGQFRKDVEQLLGRPSSERWRQGWDGKRYRVLIYPNPDAPEGLPPRMRFTEVELDPKGRVSSSFHTMWRC